MQLLPLILQNGLLLNRLGHTSANFEAKRQYVIVHMPSA